MDYPDVKTVEPIDNYNLIIIFSNGEIKQFDVKPYIKGNWFGKLKNISVFNIVRPCGKTVEWIDGQDIAPHELYKLSFAIYK